MAAVADTRGGKGAIAPGGNFGGVALKLSIHRPTFFNHKNVGDLVEVHVMVK